MARNWLISRHMGNVEALKKPKIVAIEDEVEFAAGIKKMLSELYSVETAPAPQPGMMAIASHSPDIVLLDVGLPDIDGIEILRVIKRRWADLPVIMLTGEKEPETIVRAMKAGASDYVVKSVADFKDLLNFKIAEVLKASSLAKENRLLKAENMVQSAMNKKLAKKIAVDNEKYQIVGDSPTIIKLKLSLMKLKNKSAFVLITGENGTGKELIARQLNLQEEDPSRPFIAVNCAAIPAHLIESELFGHLKGSFSGAIQDKEGLFVAANGGDIFLDEIGDLSIDLQAKLLRVLQEHVVSPVGSTEAIPIDIRVIAATNKDLMEEVRNKRFREDLYYRLNQITLHSPTLRERVSDIIPLAEYFLNQERPGAKLSKASKKELLEYEWPGNVRELQHAITKACIMAGDQGKPLIDPEHFELKKNNTKFDDGGIPSEFVPQSENDLTPSNYQNFLDYFDRIYLGRGLKLVSGDNEVLYNKLNISRANFFRKKKSLGLSRDYATEGVDS